MRDAELAAGSLFCASPLSQQRRDMLEGRSTPSPLWPGTSPHVSVNYCWVTNHPKLSLWASSQGLAGSWWRASHGGGCLGSQWLRSSCSGSLSATLSLSVLHTWVNKRTLLSVLALRCCRHQRENHEPHQVPSYLELSQDAAGVMAPTSLQLLVTWSYWRMSSHVPCILSIT